MKLKLASTLALTTFLAVPATAYAQTTIRNLQQANSVTLVGRVVQVYREDFVLDDGTGQILVEAESQPLRQAKLKPGDRITVFGTYDDDNKFEAIRLQSSDGKVIPVFDD
ncbi:NirD/YgiW/YdeI family stress tolerance protein [Microseira sp. BLCC-F43]|uniref:NirD/YgiW/YdeI family stress tolerance protein n=1 Tax=Microseira sp. BLCC-F43 TaxID=3153602 RepID=UPI0035B9C21E